MHIDAELYISTVINATNHTLYCAWRTYYNNNSKTQKAMIELTLQHPFVQHPFDGTDH
jgi:hypothetical protein